MYESWKTGQKYEPYVKVTESLLTQAFEMLVTSKSSSGESVEFVQENPESPSSLLDQALKYCQQHVKPQTSSSNTSVSHQPKGSSGTDTGADVTSGSDTEAVPSALEQTLSPPIIKNRENNTSVTPANEAPTKTPGAIPRDLITDSLSKGESTDKTPTPIEDVPMVTEVLPSSEVPMSEEVASDSNILTLESKNITPAEKELKPAPVEGAIPQEPSATVTGPPSTIALTTEAEKLLASVTPGGTVLTDGSEPSGSTL